MVLERSHVDPGTPRRFSAPAAHELRLQPPRPEPRPLRRLRQKKGDHPTRAMWRWDGADWTHQSSRRHAIPARRHLPAPCSLGSPRHLRRKTSELRAAGGHYLGVRPKARKSWTQAQPAHSPSPRRGAIAATLGGKLVMFGGDTLPPSYGDWLSVDENPGSQGRNRLDPGAAGAVSPDPRSFAGISGGGGAEIVLFGGGKFGWGLRGPAGTWTWGRSCVDGAHRVGAFAAKRTSDGGEGRGPTFTAAVQASVVRPAIRSKASLDRGRVSVLIAGRVARA